MAKTILIIEDEENLGQLLQAYLEQHQFRAFHARDGVAAMEHLAEETPDLILMDLLLPRIHGFEICQKIRANKNLKHIPIIIMTAVYKSAMDKLEARKLGVQEFIEKPIEFSQLLHKIRRYTGLENEPESMPEMELEKAAEPKITPVPSAAPPPPVPVAAAPGKIPAPATPPQPPPAISRQTVADPRIEQAQQNYTEHLPEKIDNLEKMWHAIMENPFEAERVRELHRHVHNLKGSSPTFGYLDIAELANSLEILLEEAMTGGAKTFHFRGDKIMQLLDDLRQHPVVATERQMKHAKPELLP